MKKLKFRVVSQAMKQRTMRRRIAQFCAKRSRTPKEVGSKFDISGISAGAYLSWLRQRGVVIRNGKGYSRVPHAKVPVT